MLNTSDINVKVRFLGLYQDAKWRATRIAYTLKTLLRTIEDWISKVNQEEVLSRHFLSLKNKIPKGRSNANLCQLLLES